MLLTKWILYTFPFQSESGVVYSPIRKFLLPFFAISLGRKSKNYESCSIGVKCCQSTKQTVYNHNQFSDVTQTRVAMVLYITKYYKHQHDGKGEKRTDIKWRTVIKKVYISVSIIIPNYTCLILNKLCLIFSEYASAL